MSKHLFGLGKGWLSKKIGRIAEKHGAVLVNHTDPQCQCGHGCNPFECKSSRRHWFACDNLGEPFNSRTAREVMAAIAKAEGRTE